MIIQIQKAILHVLDFKATTMAYSSELIQDEISVNHYLEKHVEKSIASVSAKPGVFQESSLFLEKIRLYQSEKLDFIPFSIFVAKRLEDALQQSNADEILNLLVMDILIDSIPYVAILGAKTHPGFAYHVRQSAESKIFTEIVGQSTLLPSTSQRMDVFAFINLANHQVLIHDSKIDIDGEKSLLFADSLLELIIKPSQSDAVKRLSKVAGKVAESYGEDQVKTELAVKNVIAEQAEEQGSLDFQKAGHEIFQDSPSMQKDFDEIIQEEGFTEPVKVDKESIIRKMSKHKLKTDTGIELTIPTQYMNSTDFVEFVTNDDGTLSITLKQISNIFN